MQRVMRVLMFPLNPLSDRYPGLVGRGGGPREHLLLMGNSATWGLAAGIVAFLT